ncbi:MAG: hypothetical protein NVSMB32_14670 [Actinomycetota bacterium]
MFRRRRGHVRLTLSEEESQVLKGLIQEYLSLLDAEAPPGDPVRARLFPSASLDDPTVDHDYRELASSDLDTHKRATAALVLGSIDRLAADQRSALGEEEQEGWLVLLTDLRLAIGVGLGITEESFDTLPDPNDPAHWPLAVMHYLGSLQESLVAALQGGA